MSNTAALLGNLLSVNANINYYSQQEIFWSNKYDANSAKLEEQVKYETKWESAYDSAIDNDKDRSVTANGSTYVVKSGNTNSAYAEKYANLKVKQYDVELSEELADLDIEYDTMKTMYDTLLEELRADQEADKTATSTAAQDTGLLQS
jgi:hypothetical protein